MQRISATYGLSAVISHVMDDGQECPTAFASRPHTKNERNYPQIEKEAPAISSVYRSQALSVHPGSKKTEVITLAAARKQSWPVISQAYNYQGEYRLSKEHVNTDTLSRLPCNNPPMKKDAEIFFFSGLEELQVDVKDISRETRRDPVLARVLNYTLIRWLTYVSSEELKLYFMQSLVGSMSFFLHRSATDYYKNYTKKILVWLQRKPSPAAVYRSASVGCLLSIARGEAPRFGTLKCRFLCFDFGCTK